MLTIPHIIYCKNNMANLLDARTQTTLCTGQFNFNSTQCTCVVSQTACNLSLNRDIKRFSGYTDFLCCLLYRNSSNCFKNILMHLVLLGVQVVLELIFVCPSHSTEFPAKRKTGSIYSCCPDDFGKHEHGSVLIFQTAVKIGLLTLLHPDFDLPEHK